ncbi:hypothetical protein ACMFMG_009243 [Clarireedia jacksonii]
MAILPSVPYIRVCVNSSTGNLKEYPDPDGFLPREPGQPRQNKMSVYVESKSGTAFRFEYYVMSKKIPENTCLGFYAVIDGHRTSSITICNEDGFKPRQWTHFFRGDRTRRPDGSLTMRSFGFAEIKTVDSDAPPVAQNDASKLGELVIQIWRIRRGAVMPPPIDQSTVPKENTRYHKKQLKGKDVSHATEFGPEKIDKGTETFFQLEYIDPVETPLVEFHFKYRSREVLQQMMIIPRDPSPTPVLRKQLTPPRRLPSPIIDVTSRQAPKENSAPPRASIQPLKSDALAASIALSRATAAALLQATSRAATTSVQADTGTPAAIQATNRAATLPTKPNPNTIPIQTKLPPVPLSNFLPAHPQIPAAPIASPAVLRAVANALPKGVPATPVETRTEATYRPDAMTPARARLRAASEIQATPLTRVLSEINKNLNHLRNIAKGTGAGSEVRTAIPQVEEQVFKESNSQMKRDDNALIKREWAQDNDEDLQIVLERPVKRRHVFTDEDHIIDLTSP